MALKNFTNEILLNELTRKNFIEEINLNFKENEVLSLYCLMLQQPNFFLKEEIDKFFQESVILLDCSDKLVCLIKNPKTSLLEKMSLSERVIQLKIPNANFEAARFYNSKSFFEQLGDITIDSKKSIRKKMVEQHCTIIANCKNIELNKKCLQCLSSCNKKLHQSIVEQYENHEK